MAVKFRDYYEILGVPRTATQDDIQRGYRKLARKYHPDVSKESGAEDKFKEIGEAYEVLRDPDKRQKYDQLGANWKAGQEFRPPPGWEFHREYGPGQGAQQSEFFWGGSGDFSDFFETLFGGRRSHEGFGPGAGGAQQRTPRRQRGMDQEATIRISLEDAYRGATKSIALQMQTVTPDGQVSTRDKTYEVRIPAGILPGQKIRLAGQGGQGMGGGPGGDLYLRVELEPHPHYRLQGTDLYTELPITPWEAALGADIEIPTLAGPVSLKIPSGAHSGQKLRLRGKGMVNPRATAGDLYVVIAIALPKKLSQQERELFEELQRVSTFEPRQGRS